MSIIHYAIEIYTDSTVTDTSIGIDSGVFRFITDRPSFDVTPTYGPEEIDIEGDDISGTEVIDVFYDGFLLKEFCTQSPSRSIDIVAGGNYSTDSSFAFKIRNDIDFWKSIGTNQIHLVGCNAIMWVIIDGVFYRIASGRVTNNPYSEEDYEFSIEDDAQMLHKTIPPQIVTVTTEEAVLDAAGNVIKPAETEDVVVPVIFGNVPYTKIAKLSTNNTFEPLNNTTGAVRFLAAAFQYTVNPTYTNCVVYLLVTRSDFTANCLVGKYLAIESGKDANTEMIYRIKSNMASIASSWSGYYSVTITLDSPIFNQDGETFSAPWSSLDNDVRAVRLSPRSTTDDTWWFKISSFSIDTKVTNGSTTIPAGVDIPLWIWDDDIKKYIDARSLIDTNSTGGTLNLLSNSATTDGEIIKLERVDFPLQSYGLATLTGNTLFIFESYGGDAIAAVTDKNRTTGRVMTQTKRNDANQYIVATYQNTVINKDYDNYYFCVDFTIEGRDYSSPIIFKNFSTQIYYDLYYLNRKQVAGTGTVTWAPGATEIFNSIPDDLMSVTGLDTGNVFNQSAGGSPAKAYRAYLKIQDPPFDTPGVNYMQFLIGVQINSIVGLTPKIKIKEIAILGESKIDTIEGDVYTRSSGELYRPGVDNGATNTVLGTFIHILEDYDGIPSKLIDYTDTYYLQSWNVGRTLTEQRNSVEYLSELASHSFVGLFSGRTGKRMLRSFVGLSDPGIPSEGPGKTGTHGPALIIRDSIDSFEKTDLSQVYNSFKLKYTYDPGSDKYLSAMSVNNIGRTNAGVLEVFPSASATDPDGELTWKRYMTGIPSYSEAKLIWEQCQYSYTINRVVKPAQADLSELPWYVDTAKYGPVLNGYGTGLFSSAFFYLKLMAGWTAVQKYTVTYSIPLTVNTVCTELLDRIKFNDTFYTHGVDVSGWVVGLEIDPNKSVIKITALIHDPLFYTDNLIIEGDHQTDTIEEDNNQTDTVVETGV